MDNSAAPCSLWRGGSLCRGVVWCLLSAVLLQGGAVKQYKGLECPLDGFELVLFSLSGTVRNTHAWRSNQHQLKQHRLAESV
jgi:hypothetical protein